MDAIKLACLARAAQDAVKVAGVEAAMDVAQKALPYLKKFGPYGAAASAGAVGLQQAGQAKDDWTLGRRLRLQQRPDFQPDRGASASLWQFRIQGRTASASRRHFH